MSMTRRQILAAGCAGVLPALASCGLPAAADSDDASRGRMGVVIHSYGIRSKDQKSGLADPLVFLEYCRTLGAAGVQTMIGARDDAYIDKVRAALKTSDMYIEGIVRLPNSAAEAERFAAELRTAK